MKFCVRLKRMRPQCLGVRRAAWVVAGIAAAIATTGCGDSGGEGGGEEDTSTGAESSGPDSVVAGDADLTFAIIGDYGDDDDNTREVADMILGWSPDFVVTVGDNDYSDGAYAGTNEGLELAVGQYFHSLIGNYQGEYGDGAADNAFFPIPGDHDWGDTCDNPNGLDDYLAYFTLPDDGPGGERYYTFRKGPIQFFALHSIKDCEPDGADVNSAQAAWVKAQAEASDADYLIALVHNPPYSSGANHIGGGDHMRWPWKEWGFDLVVGGDDHIYERIERDGLTYIVNGLGGVDQHPLADQPVDGSQLRFNSEYGAMRVSVYPTYIQLRFETTSGKVVDAFTLGDPTGGGQDGTLDPNVAPVTEGTWYRPVPGTTWQWQLQPNASGAINTSYDVEVYDLDLFDNDGDLFTTLKTDGRKVICYFSAGSFEEWREDAAEFKESDMGLPLDEWEGERWLDVRSTNVHRIMLARLDLAAAKGCDAVEPDNMDSFANSAGVAGLTPTDQLAYNRFIANAAHARGLSVGLKNDPDQIEALVDYFDFAVNEQCYEYAECDTLDPFIDANKAAFNAEYAEAYKTPGPNQATLCTSAQAQGRSTLVLPLLLDDSFRFACDD